MLFLPSPTRAGRPCKYGDFQAGMFVTSDVTGACTQARTGGLAQGDEGGTSGRAAGRFAAQDPPAKVIEKTTASTAAVLVLQLGAPQRKQQRQVVCGRAQSGLSVPLRRLHTRERAATTHRRP